MTTKKLTIGILAHVDAGKTTLSEGLLYLGGCIRSPGRVDHKNTFLDIDEMERSRGITIFSKQAVLELPDMTVYLLDTPGHTDFSAEMERTLDVLDYAVLVLSGSDGVQIHTETVWRLLSRHKIPAFLFINKMDLPGKGRQALTEELHRMLSPACIDFSAMEADRGLFDEQTALCSEELMEEYLDTGKLSDRTLSLAVEKRQIFPCYFGSALKLDGVSSLMKGLSSYTRQRQTEKAFGARVYKIGRDPQGNRLTYLRMTGGILRVKDMVSALDTDRTTPLWAEKVDQIRIYSGAKYRVTESVSAGDVCAVTGLTAAMPGDGLGTEEASEAPQLTPVLSYRLVLPDGIPTQEACAKLMQLAEEDPQLHLAWDADLREIHISLMGEMQMEVLKLKIAERFGMEVSFDSGSILYQETLSEPVECAGHFEPLRHYAEVHFLLEPGEPGSGIVYDSVCSDNDLKRNWQNLILSQLAEDLPSGVLTGSPVTDLRIVLTGGRAHVKHTEGGDFRQAAVRAFRQGLMKARKAGSAVLLEPWYEYRISVPQEQAGRVMTDMQMMCGTMRPMEINPETGSADFSGCAPASEMRSYPSEVQNFTHGRGRCSFAVHGYAPCHDPDAVTEAFGYEPERDTVYPADSVFCSSGAGVLVPWDEADARMHAESVFQKRESADTDNRTQRPGRTLSSRSGVSHSRPYSYADAMEEDRELKAIFERTYGPISARSIFVPPPPVTEEKPKRETYLDSLNESEEYLLVDGYNIIFAWEELSSLARESLDLARQTLIHILTNYQGYCKCNLILVFDAYRIRDSRGSVERHAGIYVIYTRTSETADTYIEKVTYDIGRQHRVRVATSDALEQVIVMGHGAERLSAAGFHEEVCRVNEEIEALVETINQTGGKTGRTIVHHS